MPVTLSLLAITVNGAGGGTSLRLNPFGDAGGMDVTPGPLPGEAN
jgi:hypothetical protein